MMANQAMQRGPIGDRFAFNMRELRRRRGLDQAGLSACLDEIGQPIGTNSISRLEKGERRADVSELVALAVALDCAPSRLYLPASETPEEVHLTAVVAAPWRRVWQWAAGERPLVEPPVMRPGTYSVALYHAVAEWRRLNRPHDRETVVTADEVLEAEDQLTEVVQAVRAAEERGVPRNVLFAYLRFLETIWLPSFADREG